MADLMGDYGVGVHFLRLTTHHSPRDFIIEMNVPIQACLGIECVGIW